MAKNLTTVGGVGGGGGAIDLNTELWKMTTVVF